VTVLDASAAIELLLNTPLGELVGRRLAAAGQALHAPHLLDVEVLHVVRRLCAVHAVTDRRARQALADLADLPLVRHSHEHLVARAWSLRASLTAYDAMYVALAEGLDARLLTCDGRLARAHGHQAEIDLVEAGG
jgi:predicted nucleic acid-binding protein